MYEKKYPEPPANIAPGQQPLQRTSSDENRRKRSVKSKAGLFIIGATVNVALIATGASAVILYRNVHSNPVPKSISKQVDFPIYYPDQKKLPSGYSLNKESFNVPQNGVVLYAVDYPNGKLVISVQKQPTDEEIQNFYNNYIPLRTKVHTNLGQAEFGAHNTILNKKLVTQSVVSLPTYKESWLIITAPQNTDQKKLKDTLNSLKK